MKRALRPVLLWFVCLLGAGGWIGTSMEVSHDLAAFLPDRGRPFETLLISRANQGAISRMVMFAFAGGELDQRLDASREAEDRLGQIAEIEQTANGAQSLDALAFEPLFAYRYLLGEQQPLDPAGLRAALEARLKELRSPLGPAAKQHLDSDPTASFRALLLGWSQDKAAPDQEDGLWVTPDRARALSFATIAETKSDPGLEAAAIAGIRAVLADIGERHEVDVLLAGRPMLIADAQASIHASFVVGSIAASALVILLLLWMYRSIGVLLLGILPLLSGVLAGLVAVLVLLGPVHGIALAFGVTLLGLAIDYPLHLFSHSRPGESLVDTARKIERPILLGALTTVGAFAIFGAGKAPGLGQLACFAAFGILAAVLTLRYVVPNLAAHLRIEPSPRLFDLLPAVAPRALLWVVVLLGAGSAIFLASRHDRLFEADIDALSPLPEAAKQLDRELRADLGAPDLRHLFLIRSGDVETVLKRAEALVPALEKARQAGIIAGFDSPTRYLPSLERQAARQAALPAADDLAAALTVAQQALPFKAGLFSPFLEAVETSRALTPLTGEAGLRLFEETPLGARLEQLLLRADDQYYGILPVIGVADIAGLETLAAGSRGIELIDLKALFQDMLSTFRQEAFVLLALGAGVVLLLLSAFRYSPARILRIFLVLILALTVTAAALLLLGEKLTMLHILAALLVVGLGLDYTIFFTWPEADRHQRRRTRHALSICVLSTVLVFGLLANSSIDVLSAIGLTVALGACTTFVIAYAILSRQNE